MRDFTLAAYEKLLVELRDSKRSVYGVRDWVRTKPTAGVLIRHDVDRRPANSLAFARLERRHDILTTYYFRITSNSFAPAVISEIASLGHEIGYHYEDLSLANGDVRKAEELFRAHLQKLRAFAPIETIAFHGRPFSPHDNVRMWDSIDFRKHGIEAEAFKSIDYRGVYYFTDTGRTWAQGGVNLRDHVDGGLSAPISTTPDLVQFVRDRPDARIAIVAHPERWDDNLVLWAAQNTKDQAINLAKRGIRVLRKRRT